MSPVSSKRKSKRLDREQNVSMSVNEENGRESVLSEKDFDEITEKLDRRYSIRQKGDR